MTDRLGNLIEYQVECGHWMVCYALEPTPTMCPDCADESRKALSDIVDGVDTDWNTDIPSLDELTGWLDETGVTNTDLRADIERLVTLYEDGYEQMQQAYFEGRKMLAKYPPAERLTMPKESAQ